MQLEVGKYYKTRDGRKFGPMYKTGSKDHNMEFDDGSGSGWTKRGTWLNTCQDERDLIAEWTDTPAPVTLSAETIDHIAIDSLKFHTADNDMEPLQKEAFRIVLRYYGVTL